MGVEGGGGRGGRRWALSELTAAHPIFQSTFQHILGYKDIDRQPIGGPTELPKSRKIAQNRAKSLENGTLAARRSLKLCVILTHLSCL